METCFEGKRIESMLGILPEKIGYFDDEVNNYSFPSKQTLRLKKVMGYDHHRLSKETSTVSDFVVCGLNYILDNSWIMKEDIGAIIVMTLCPDYYVPHISNIVQSKCGLNTDIICMDISQGCCGFLLGLMESFMILEHLDNKKVILVNGDVLSHKISKYDRNDFPLIGDGTAITILSNGGNDKIYYEMHNDGSRSDVLKIPAGGFRLPCSSYTAKLIDQGDGNFRALDHMHMNGSEVFNFVQSEVPMMLDNAFKKAKRKKEDIDWFLFHQPNKFMLQKLVQKVGIPEEKTPMNLVENFGNLSGACIPMTAIFNIKNEMLSKTLNCCLSAFGSGLAWGTMFINIGPLSHCEIIDTNL